MRSKKESYIPKTSESNKSKLQPQPSRTSMCFMKISADLFSMASWLRVTEWKRLFEYLTSHERGSN